MPEHLSIIAGVDTHADTHYAAIVSSTGEHLGAAQFPATEAGYRALAGFITCYGPLKRVGVEGTNSFGAGLTRHLRSVGINVVEVIRPARQTRRMRGKSDEIDAYAAAQLALADNDTVTPKTNTGAVEALRVTSAARRSAVKAHAETMTQIKSLLVTAPEQLRSEYRDLSAKQLIARLASARVRSVDDQVAACTRRTLKRLAVRYQQLNAEIRQHETALTQLVRQVNPALLQIKGVGTVTAARLLVTAGDNPTRIRSEGAFAMLCGVAPIPASSGKTDRYRINWGGNRAANCALHQIVIVRLGTDATTRAYAQRRTAEGKSKKDIIRCLKRAVAREMFHHITQPQAVATGDDLKPIRRRLGYSQIDAADALGCSTVSISRIERGQARDIKLLRRYRGWLTDQHPTQTAA